VGATYTYAIDRTAHVRRSHLTDIVDLRLAAVSLVAVAAIVLTTTGKFAASSFDGSPAHAIDLNLVRDARALEPALGAVFSNAADRQFAATALFQSLHAEGSERIVNVGAIGRVRVSPDAVRRVRGLERYAERAQGRDAPFPLLTASDISTVKPSFVVRTRRDFVRTLLWSVLLYIAGFHLVTAWWWWRGGRRDRVLLAAAHLLTAIGLCAIIARPDPLRDALLFPRYAETIFAGLVLMAAVSEIDFRSPQFRQLAYIPLLSAAGLSVMLILFGRGPGGSTARVNLGPVQPIEAIRLLLLLFLAGYFAQRWELLRQLRQTAFRGRPIPAWLDVPRAEYALPVVAGVALALGLLFLQKDLGPALIVGLLFLGLYSLARGRIGMPLAGLALLLFGFFVCYTLQIPSTVVDRVRIWQSPWNNAVRGGDQIAHAFWTLASGGPLGTGLGLGATRYLPAGHTDLVLASVGEELGAVGLIVVAILYIVVCWRAYTTAKRASTDYELFLAAGVMLLIAIPTLLMACATLGIVPLTGVVTPFLSYGGSAMTANFAALGILASIRAHAIAESSAEPLHAPLVWLGRTVAVVALVPLVALANVQVRLADKYAIEPHLGLQADGSRRFEYNPRILDVVRDIPRGSVYDRTGLPLATDAADVAAKAGAEYRKLGIAMDAACGGVTSRCYPLGGRAFHVLGDARSRVNWSASNTSFIERDDESKLRGFDDRAQDVAVDDGHGGRTWTVRRDFAAVLPLLRHRYQPNHPQVKALLAGRHDVHLTLDARLQTKVADIVAKYAGRSADGRAAAVVVDADSGDLLASVSYPWPAATADGFDPSDQAALLDRARFGWYPPGSTFKLVTAAAALRQNPRSSEQQFTCVPLGDGRVGARIAGWSRPVRDDVMDHSAHGTLDMHGAMVVSCNAYFAQLAMKIGPQALLETARALNVALARGNTVARIRDTLPQIGYGQGEVVVSPLKMAQVASAIASGGRVPQVQTERDPGAEVATTQLLPPSSARLLASYMRDVVVSGTGRSLRGASIPIAGKTGTAEIAGAPSHAWFVGFAPYAPSRRHIAFAILIEHAGYGGTAAAPAAGEIVSAAAALGLIKGN
jgi:cell division protein FtsW (lipid II flippase)